MLSFYYAPGQITGDIIVFILANAVVTVKVTLFLSLSMIGEVVIKHRYHRIGAMSIGTVDPNAIIFIN